MNDRIHALHDSLLENHQVRPACSSMPTRAIDVDITRPEELKAALYGIDHDWMIECIANILAEHDQAESELANIMEKHWQIPSVIAMTRRVHELKTRVIAEVNEA